MPGSFLGIVLPCQLTVGVTAIDTMLSARAAWQRPGALALVGSLSAGLMKYDGPWYWPRALEWMAGGPGLKPPWIYGVEAVPRGSGPGRRLWMRSTAQGAWRTGRRAPVSL